MSERTSPCSSGSESLPPIQTTEMCSGDQFRKLAVLGLPWDTSDETLKQYFSQFGALEHAEIMKDSHSGKSRGFGFVTFQNATAAQRALLTDHSIDGRRCEAKIALPKGEPSPPRTTRIFVARIPPSISEAHFRTYFEAFGKLQDAYMPRDHSKQGYRGIGFVTYSCPDSVEKVMAVKHWLHGHEIAIDRATPKDEPTIFKNVSMALYKPAPLNPQRRSFDNGAGIVGPGLHNVMHMSSGPNAMGEGQVHFSTLSSLSEDCEAPSDHLLVHERDMHAAFAQDLSSSYAAQHLPNMAPANSLCWAAQLGQQNRPGGALNEGSGHLAPSDASMRARQALGMGLGDLTLQKQRNAAASALQSLANAQSTAAAAAAAAQSYPSSMDSSAAYNTTLAQLSSLQLAGAGGLPLMTEEQRAELLFAPLTNAVSTSGMLPELSHPAMQQIMAAHAASNRRSLDNSGINMSRRSIGENPAIASARAGPRIFVGKLTKDTTEADVKEYFMRFGYVMDVYLPKSKDNKVEHRGFGFVTFETEAAIQRVVSHGSHRLRGSTIAIDIAMPKIEDDGGEVHHSSGSRNSFENVSYGSHASYNNALAANLGAQLPMVMVQTL